MKKLLLFLSVYGALPIEIYGQEIIWSKKISDSLFTIKEMKMDTSGNFYLLGNLNSNHSSIPFLAKLDTLTELLWAKTFQTTNTYNVS